MKFDEYDDEVKKELLEMMLSEINHNKHELFHDFLIKLLDYIDQTFLGDEYLVTLHQQEKHFEWCWFKTIESFRAEKIFFRGDDKFNLYFYTLINDEFYKKKKTNDLIPRLKSRIDYLFSEEQITEDEFELYFEIYSELNILLNYDNIRKNY